MSIYDNDLTHCAVNHIALTPLSFWSALQPSTLSTLLSFMAVFVATGQKPINAAVNLLRLYPAVVLVKVIPYQ